MRHFESHIVSVKTPIISEPDTPQVCLDRGIEKKHRVRQDADYVVAGYTAGVPGSWDKKRNRVRQDADYVIAGYTAGVPGFMCHDIIAMASWRIASWT